MGKKKHKGVRGEQGSEHSHGVVPVTEGTEPDTGEGAEDAGPKGGPERVEESRGESRSADSASHPAPTLVSLKDDVRAQREARRQGGKPDRSGKGHDVHTQGKSQPGPGVEKAPPGFVRSGTLYISIAVALVAGLFIGSLLPGLTGHNLSSAPQNVSQGGQSGQTGQNGGAPSGSPNAQQEQNLARLAGHILELEEAVRKNPEDVNAWVQLGNLYFDTGKAPQSINAYERALLLRPNDANVLTDLGIMYREAGKYDLAVESFRKATQIDPKHQNALFNRGVVLFFDLKRKEDARKVWQELLAVNPKAAAPDGKSVRDMLRDLK